MPVRSINLDDTQSQMLRAFLSPSIFVPQKMGGAGGGSRIRIKLSCFCLSPLEFAFNSPTNFAGRGKAWIFSSHPYYPTTAIPRDPENLPLTPP
jgi:hypothetical protein